MTDTSVSSEGLTPTFEKIIADLQVAVNGRQERLLEEERISTEIHSARVAEMVRQEGLKRKFLDRALRTLSNLQLLGRSEHVQKLIDLDEQLNKKEHRDDPYGDPSFTFFHAIRSTGVTWDTKGEDDDGGYDLVAMILLKRDGVHVYYGTSDVFRMGRLVFPYDMEVEEAEEILRMAPGLKDRFDDPEQLSWVSDLSKALKGQWKYAWEPEDLIIQILRGGYNRAVFQRYVARALADLQRRF